MPPQRINLFAMPLAGVLAAALCGCGGGRGGQSATSVQLPAGITPASAAGIYPAGGDEQCCWTGPDVRFQVAVAGAPQTIRLDVFEPKLGPFTKSPQTISLLDAGGAVVASRRVAAGAPVNVSFPLSGAGAQAGVLTVHLRMATSYVPKDIGLGPDLRRLALIVKGVSTQ